MIGEWRRVAASSQKRMQEPPPNPRARRPQACHTSRGDRPSLCARAASAPSPPMATATSRTTTTRTAGGPPQLHMRDCRHSSACTLGPLMSLHATSLSSWGVSKGSQPVSGGIWFDLSRRAIFGQLALTCLVALVPSALTGFLVAQLPSSWLPEQRHSIPIRPLDVIWCYCR